MSMPDKLIIKSMLDPSEDAIDSQVEIAIDSDGVLHKLTRVKRLMLHLDSEEPPQVVFTVYTKGLATEVEIDRYTAQAVLRACATRELAFLDDKDAAALRKLQEHGTIPPTGHGSLHDIELANAAKIALHKIIVELAIREEIPF
jgi:hypothetical protein